MIPLATAVEHQLREYINHDAPFGPIKAEDIDPCHHHAHYLLFEQNNSLYAEISRNPKIIIGRKGSGKTAYLTSVYLDEKYSFIVNINTADIFIKVIEYIDSMLPQSVVFSEKVSDFWKTVIEISVMATLIEQDSNAYSQLPYVREYLAQIEVLGLSSADEIVWRVVNFLRNSLKDRRIGIIAEALSIVSEHSFEQCKHIMYEYLYRTQQKVVILIDTLDEYKPNPKIGDVIAGLLKCVGTFNSKQHCADIRLCVPAELYHLFSDASSNPTKDFSSKVILHWHPRELILLASSRFQLYLRLYYPALYDKYIINNYNDFDQSLSLLQRFMPIEVLNGLNFEENTLVYLLRHTQLLPRHFLLILNNVFRQTVRSLERPKVNREAVVKGVAASESLLTDEIFTSYKHVHRNAKGIVERCVPELPFHFSVSKLDEVFNEVVRTIFDDDIHTFIRMLIEIGIIGKHIRSEDSYHETLFEYAVSNQLHFSLNDTFCIHPLFLNKFSASYRNEDYMTVYPKGTNPFTDEDYRLMR